MRGIIARSETNGGLVQAVLKQTLDGCDPVTLAIFGGESVRSLAPSPWSHHGVRDHGKTIESISRASLHGYLWLNAEIGAAIGRGHCAKLIDERDLGEPESARFQFVSAACS